MPDYNLLTLQMIRNAIETLNVRTSDVERLANHAMHSPARNWFGQQPVWEDMRVGLERSKISGVTAPSWAVFRNGIYAYSFADGNEAFFSVQLSHTYKLATTIYPHLHWAPSSDVNPSDNVGIGLEYSWADIHEDFPASTTLQRDVPTGINNDHNHLIHNFDDDGIDATAIAGNGVSSMLMCRFFRQAAAADNYAAGIFALEVDFHFQLDTFGSYQISDKWGP